MWFQAARQGSLLISKFAGDVLPDLLHQNVCTDNYWCTGSGVLQWSGRPKTVLTKVADKAHIHWIIQLCNCSGLDFVLVRRCRTLGVNLATVLQLATVLLMFHHELWWMCFVGCVRFALFRCLPHLWDWLSYTVANLHIWISKMQIYLFKFQKCG